MAEFTRRWWPIALVALMSGCGAGGVLVGDDDDDVDVIDDDDDATGDDDGGVDDDDSAEQVPAAEEPTLAFSTDRGFADAPFDLTITASTDDCEVVYTLDCSEPATSPAPRVGASPLTLAIDPENSDGRDVAPVVTVRALARCPGDVTGVSQTHSYVFAGRVADLSPDTVKPGPGWPAIYDTSYYLDSTQAINYGMDPDVTGHPAYADLIDDALLAIPSVVLSTDLANLFDDDTGIYVNAMEHGIDWERPVSMELLDPGDDGSGAGEFGVNAGLRIRGGWSRHSDNPKHALRVFFRGEYGPGKLDFPLFGDEGTSEFDDIDLRTAQNYSWSYKGDTGAVNTMTRDVFSRDVQRELGQPYTRSRYYHVYLDGQYWGLFQTQERSEASFAEQYLGGGRDDYDVVKVDGDDPENRDIEATDGTLDVWERIWQLCEAGLADDGRYYELQGKLADGTVDPHGEVLVDIDNLIDYMLVIFYAGNFDSPTGSFTGNDEPNNFFLIRDRTNADKGFVFFAHDAEHTLHTQAWSPGVGVLENRVNLGTVGGYYQMDVDQFAHFHPQWLHFKLTVHADYRQRFRDRAHEVLTGDGVLTPQRAADLFAARAAEIELAIIAESARWGDSKWFNDGGRTYRTRDDDWAPTVQDTIDHFFLGLDGYPNRTDTVLQQLLDAGLYWE